MLCCCVPDITADAQVYTRLEELENRRIGVSTGTVQAIQVETRFPNAKIYYFSNGVDCILEWNQGNHFKDADLRTAKAFSWVLNRI